MSARQEIEDALITRAAALEKAIDTNGRALDALAHAKVELRRRQDAVLLRFIDSPKEMGGNEATREAFLRCETATYQNGVDLAQLDATQAASDLEIARLRWEAVRQQVRLATTLLEV